MRVRCSFPSMYFIAAFIFLLSHRAIGQCSPQMGPPPSNLYFNSASNHFGGKLAAGAADLNWTVSVDDINGTYNPATVMSALPDEYYKSPWGDCDWISVNAAGNHAHNANFFYRSDFNLPCTNPCGKSYNNDNVFCLSLDIFSDNSIYEIYVNGVPQSGNLGNIIPVKPDPYHAAGDQAGAGITVSLCHDWKAGANTIVIEVASSPPFTGILVQGSEHFQQTLSNFIVDSMCENTVYHFGNQDITHAGNYTQTFHTASGCDSIVGLELFTKAIAESSVNKTICQGDNFLGYDKTGTYIDTLVATNGCDSIRTLSLQVTPAPAPDLGNNLSICKGDSLVLSPGRFQTYLWQDSSTSDHFVVKDAGLYSVTVTGVCGSATASVQVTNTDCQIHFPKAFTPNGDGINDKFRILTSYRFTEFDLSVFDRWGRKVFETKDPATGWDGKMNGTPQDSAAFVWICSYRTSAEAATLKGIVMLVR